MSDATGELAHRVHLHGLAQLVFGSGSFLAFQRQLLQRLFQRTGTSLDLKLKIIVEPAQHFFVLLFSIYINDDQDGASDLPLAVVQRYRIDACP